VPVAIVSGRDLEDVRGHVAVDGFAYAGSHGFDMRLADGTREQYGTEFLPDLDAAERVLRERLGDVAGVRVERKGFAIAVHFRGASSDARAVVEEVITGTVADADGSSDAAARLRITGGKDIFELRPDIEWDKGRALTRLIAVLDLDESRYAPVYIGDDLTDEDGFAAVNDTGISIVVAGEVDRRTIAQYRLDDPAAVRDFLQRMHDRAAQST